MTDSEKIELIRQVFKRFEEDDPRFDIIDAMMKIEEIINQ